MINAFRGRWTKLGNYSLCTVFFEGHAYMSIEHAYQAAKFDNEWLQRQIREQPTPNMAKQLARRMEEKGLRRQNWHVTKDIVMLVLLREKFVQEPERSILLSTGDQPLKEGNWWHDNYWGACTCAKCHSIEKHNTLGKMLMTVREELRDGRLESAESEG